VTKWKVQRPLLTQRQRVAAAASRHSAIGASRGKKQKNILVTLRLREKKSPDITHPLSFFQRLALSDERLAPPPATTRETRQSHGFER
jgi:hypothetical protein